MLAKIGWIEQNLGSVNIAKSQQLCYLPEA
jgi:hypothetical protein